jgi:hypothetical protein
MHLSIPAVSMLIVSCDRYSDLWNLQMAALQKFWPDCPFRRYLITNLLGPVYKDTEALVLGEDQGWSANLLSALGRIQTEFVLLWLDDLLLLAAIDNRLIRNAVEEFVKQEGNCLKLLGSPGLIGTGRTAGAVSLEPVGGAYRVSTVATLWRRSVLVGLLRESESAWQFEIHGSRRADEVGGFYFLSTSSLRLVNTVVRGKWSRFALRHVRREIDPGYVPQRNIMAPFTEFQYQARLLLSKAWRFIPVSKSRGIRDLIKSKRI